MFPFEVFAKDGGLQYDEQQVEDPGERAHGNVGEAEAQDGRDAGKGCNTQVGFDGQAHTQRHYQETQGGDAVSDQQAIGFGHNQCGLLSYEGKKKKRHLQRREEYRRIS